MIELKAVFWDVDGTIADTEICGHRVAFNLAFRDFDLDWYWNETTYIDLLKISGGLNRIIHYRNQTNSDLTDEKCANVQFRKRFHYKELVLTGKIKLRKGVLRLIDELANLEIKQVIVTTSGKKSLEPFLYSSLESHIQYFTKIITYEDVQNHKPAPDAYELAKQVSEMPCENSIAIEDSMIGVEAAKAANINCLLTLPPWSCSSKNITNKANACVDSLGNSNSHSKLIYGNPLISNIVDFEYLTNIIN